MHSCKATRDSTLGWGGSGGVVWCGGVCVCVGTLGGCSVCVAFWGWGGVEGWVCVLVTQSCLTLYNPMDCSPPGSPVHGILQARILEWVAISFSRGSYRPRDQTQVSCTAGGFFIVWATREAKALPDFMGEVNWHDLPSCPWPQSTELLSQPLSLLGHLSAMSVPTISVGGGSLSISSPIYCWLHVTLGVQSYRHGSGGRW